MFPINPVHTHKEKGIISTYFPLDSKSFHPDAKHINVLCVCTYGRSGKISTRVNAGALKIRPSNHEFSFNYPDDFGMNVANMGARATEANILKQHWSVLDDLQESMDLACDYYRTGGMYAKAA